MLHDDLSHRVAALTRELNEPAAPQRVAERVLRAAVESGAGQPGQHRKLVDIATELTSTGRLTSA